MTEPVPAAGVLAALHRFGLERERLRAAVARAVGMAPADLEALGLLRSGGPTTQRELGDRLMLTSGAVTALVDRLVAAGLAERHPNPGDRRSVHVRATGPAHPALVEVDRAIEAAAAALDDRGRADCVRLLEAAARAAGDAVGLLGAPLPRRPTAV